MQFDFNLGPGASQTIDVKGRFVKYKEGAGPIRVRTSTGGFVDVLPGQGIENVNFTSLTIADRSGADNAGSILAGDFDFRDDRITGTVDIVDGGKSRTRAGVAFMGSMNTTGTATNFPYVQLWNPPGSGKNIVLEGVVLTANGAGEIYFGPGSVAMANGYGTAVSKRFAAGVPASVAQLRGTSDPGYLLANSFGSVLVAASQPVTLNFKEPVVIEPGYGFLIVGYLAGATPKVVATVEYFEDKS